MHREEKRKKSKETVLMKVVARSDASPTFMRMAHSEVRMSAMVPYAHSCLAHVFGQMDIDELRKTSALS